MLDLLIRGGKLLDFNRGLVDESLGIKDGRIVYMGKKSPPSKRLIELRGEIVSPGFIDIHMHEEDLLLSGGNYDIALAMLRMGVTTAVAGNCGNNRQDLRTFIDHIDKKGAQLTT